jgi:hypothetical protein
MLVNRRLKIVADIIKLIQKQPDLYTMNGASNEDIKQVEQLLKLHFAADYRKYVATFGAASFAGHELTGVCNSKRLSVAEVTIKERNNVATLDDWYVIEQVNIDGIVMWQDASGAVYQTAPNTKAKKICKSLAEYINL